MKPKIPVGTFDKLYDILYGILLDRCTDRFKFNYYNEIVEIEFRYNDKMLYVLYVSDSTDFPDYGYVGNSMELYNWMLREDPQQCIVELEKTIIELT